MKDGVERYVSIIRKLFLAFGAVMLPLIIVSLIFAVMGYMAFWIIAPVLTVLFLVVYGFYAMRVSMGTVLGISVNDQTLDVKTRRRTFTYDAKMGCIAVKTYKNKFVCTFRTQDSQDKFIFYRSTPLSSGRGLSHFTLEDIRRFYPDVQDCEY